MRRMQYCVDLLSRYMCFVGHGEFGKSDKLTGAVAWTESDQSSKPVWTKLHKED